MRLTLRTMLAYLDDVLEPEDAEELGQKIGESEFASELVYRALTSTRKLELSAPAVLGTGIGRDANSVAQYLDNSLPRDQVPDFEHICLESDEQLAEVTSCHRILTMVLAEPADVPDALRARVQSLGQASGTASGETAAADVLPTEPQTLVERREAGRQPEYLAAGSSRLRERIIPGTILVILFTMVALRMVGRFDSTHPLLGSFFPVSVEKPVLSDSGDDPSSALAFGSSHSSQLDDPNRQQPLAANKDLQLSMQTGGDSLLFRTGTEKPWKEMQQGDLFKNGMQALSLPACQPQVAISNGMQLTMHGVGQFELTPALTAAGVVLHLERGRVQLANVGARDSELKIQIGPWSGTVELPLPGASMLLEVARYLPAGEDPREASSIPVARVICVGSARWTQDDTGKGVQRISDEPGYQVHTLIGEQDAIVGQSSVLPAWAQQRDGAGSLERKAALELIDGRDKQLPFRNAMRAQYDTHRKPEVRALAARCLATLGEYDAVVRCWSKEEYRACWELQLKQVQSDLAWGEGRVELVLEVLEEYRKQDSELLFRMLSGYSPAQLEAEAGAELVESLSHEEMDIRLLAYSNLHWTTGRTQQYQVHRSPDRELPHIQGWRRLLKDGLVRYQQAPQPVNALAPLETR